MCNSCCKVVTVLACHFACFRWTAVCVACFLFSLVLVFFPTKTRLIVFADCVSKRVGKLWPVSSMWPAWSVYAAVKIFSRSFIKLYGPRHYWIKITYILMNRETKTCLSWLLRDFMVILLLSLCTAQYSCMTIFYFILCVCENNLCR